MSMEYMALYHSFLTSADSLSDRELGRVLRAALIYSARREDPSDLTRSLRPIYAVLKEQIDRDAARYAARCAKNKQIIDDYWRGVRDGVGAVNERIRTNTNEYQDKGKEKEKDRNIPPKSPRVGRGRKRDLTQYDEEDLRRMEAHEVDLNGGSDERVEEVHGEGNEEMV